MTASRPRGKRQATPALPLWVPWGVGVRHNVSTLDLLAMPLTFTQNELLTPEEFADRARRRGLSIHVAQLLELHRRRLFVPFLQLRRPVLQERPSRWRRWLQVATRKSAVPSHW